MATIGAMAGKNVQQSLRSYGNHSSADVAMIAIVATTIAEKGLSSIVYQTYFPAIAVILAIIWKPALTLPFLLATT